jgi:hypothetical protein
MSVLTSHMITFDNGKKTAVGIRTVKRCTIKSVLCGGVYSGRLSFFDITDKTFKQNEVQVAIYESHRTKCH